ncbi:MAG: HK97 gp10 family phage protein [Bosea sp. (in: a-proteobacteria)]
MAALKRFEFEIAGPRALIRAAKRVRGYAALNTPGRSAYTPYEPTSSRTGMLARSITTTLPAIEFNRLVIRIGSSNPYARRQEYRKVRSGNPKSYLRKAVRDARIGGALNFNAD